MQNNVIYYGETQCQATVKSTHSQCTNHAYYLCSNEQYMCGVHSKKEESTRVKLPTNPNKKENEQHIHHMRKMEQLATAQMNKESGMNGQVIVSKMSMMKQPIQITGFVNVYPNYKHGGRTDGLGLPRLSPKSLGPVCHGMPGLPDATSIENYHQYAKFWPHELDENGQIKEECKQQRIEAYRNGPPMRHKHSRETLLQYGKNVNVPYFRPIMTPMEKNTDSIICNADTFIAIFMNCSQRKSPIFTN